MNRLYLRMTINNVFISLVKKLNSLVVTKSSGICGFSGRQKRTRIACVTILTELCKIITFLSLNNIFLYFNGCFKWRRLILKIIFKYKIKIKCIVENFKVSLNGCKAKKKRRK